MFSKSFLYSRYLFWWHIFFVCARPLSVTKAFLTLLPTRLLCQVLAMHLVCWSYICACSHTCCNLKLSWSRSSTSCHLHPLRKQILLTIAILSIYHGCQDQASRSARGFNTFSIACRHVQHEHYHDLCFCLLEVTTAFIGFMWDRLWCNQTRLIAYSRGGLPFFRRSHRSHGNSVIALATKTAPHMPSGRG